MTPYMCKHDASIRLTNKIIKKNLRRDVGYVHLERARPSVS
jgi:hypothetical protein